MKMNKFVKSVLMFVGVVVVFFMSLYVGYGEHVTNEQIWYTACVMAVGATALFVYQKLMSR
jgi:hypothetical protein